MADCLVPSMLIEASSWQRSVKTRNIVIGGYGFFELIDDKGSTPFALEIRKNVYAGDMVAVIASRSEHVSLVIESDAHVTRCDSLSHMLKAMKIAEEIYDCLRVVFRIDAANRGEALGE